MEATKDMAVYRPELYKFTPDAPPVWCLFHDIAVTTVTFNRLEYTKKFVDSLYQKTHLPFTLYIFDQASTDGTAEYLTELEQTKTNVVVTRFPQNIGLSRALFHSKKTAKGDLMVHFDNDIEILSNYWLAHVLKAFYAYFLATGGAKIALGLRMANQEEYGFRYAKTLKTYAIPTAKNALPRTSFSMRSHKAAAEEQLDETVCLGHTDHLCGGAWAMPMEHVRHINWQDFYPKGLGGVDGFTSQECLRLGLELAYIENGPLCFHHDWPYTDEKIALYARLTQERVVTDLHYVKWKVKDLLKRFRRVS